MTAPSNLDWADVNRRLETARHALAGDTERSPEETAQLLAQRAQALARPPESAAAPAAHDVMLLSLGGEWRAIEVDHVQEALPASPPTPVPGTPAFLLGVISRRGRVVPVFDVARLLGLPPAAGTTRHVVVVRVAAMTFGIAADEVEGPLPRDADERLVSPLDLEELAADGRLTIEEDR